MEALNIFIATTQFLLCIFLICHGVKVLKESKESIRIAEARLEIAKLEIEQQEVIDNDRRRCARHSNTEM